MLAPRRAQLDGSWISSGAEQPITGAPLSFQELVGFVPIADIELPFEVPPPATRVAH